MTELADLRRIKSWSYSLVTLHERCPYQTLQARIIKSVKTEDSKAMLHGNVVHKIIEDRLKHGTPVPAEHAYLQPVIEPFTRLRAPAQLHVEHEMAVDRNLTPCKWFGGAVTWGRAKADLLVVQGSLALLCDWKTGKLYDDVVDQLELEALFAFWHYPELETIVGQAYGVGGGRLLRSEPIKVAREDLPALWGRWMNRLQPLAQSFTLNDWVKIPGVYCRWCPVAACPLHPR